MNAAIGCFTLLLLHSARSLVIPITRMGRPNFAVATRCTLCRSHEDVSFFAVPPRNNHDNALPMRMVSSAEDVGGVSFGGIRENCGANIDRRSVLSLPGKIASAAAFSGMSILLPRPRPAIADGSKKLVVVFGGSGWVGAHVDEILYKRGYDVVSVARSSPSDQAAKVKTILGSALPITYKSLDAATSADLADVVKGASAVISCVGVAPGGRGQREGNGAVNVRIANAAKDAGIDRFVYVSVSSELAGGPAKFLFGDYLKGKAEAEAAVVKSFGTDHALVVKPTIIAGGPPGELRPPGPPGITPVPVDAIARAVVAGALGDRSGSIDGNAAIVAL